jgi:cytochrome o ubiquinol oxidase subunit IV
MSADSHHAESHHDDHGASHASRKGYVTGFLMSVVLTAIPFYLVMSGVLSPLATSLIIIALAVVQIVVHMIYFLHMNTKSENGWSMMALIFTIVMVVIALSGSLWVMNHLNSNMMPIHEMTGMK